MATEMQRISTDLPKYIVEYVDEYKEKTGISKSRIYTDALKMYLKGKLNKEIKQWQINR